MTAIRTVLCPVDFSAATPRQVGLAADLCRVFQARLVLHHNLAHLAPGAGVGWMWAADHPSMSTNAAEEKLQALLADLPPDLTKEAHVTRGPASEAVVKVSEDIDADLVVLSTHGTPSDDHASVTEQVIARGRRGVLALHETHEDQRTLTFTPAGGPVQVALVPTDLSPESRAAVEVAVDLARRWPFELHLLHLLDVKRHQTAADAAHARYQMEGLLPDDLREAAVLHVEAGDAVDGIVRLATNLSAACIVMGEHTRMPLRRWFSRDTSNAVLRQAPCPVWYVPGTRAA
jgi:nucleotide-binding universal stress UspA family protein